MSRPVKRELFVVFERPHYAAPIPKTFQFDDGGELLLEALTPVLFDGHWWHVVQLARTSPMPNEGSSLPILWTQQAYAVFERGADPLKHKAKFSYAQALVFSKMLEAMRNQIPMYEGQVGKRLGQQTELEV